MENSYWQKQLRDKPLFEDILWSRPENKSNAGKLAVIGGHQHSFSAPGIAYAQALEAGAGVCHVLLPQAVYKTVKHVLPAADFAPSNPSGSFAKQAIDDLLRIANWSDATLLAGDFGRNSETAVLLESFVQKYDGLLTVAQDAVDYFKSTPKLLLEREKTLIVLSLAQLQKMFINTPIITPITHSMSAVQLVEALHELTEKYPACVAVKHHEQIFISSDGRVVSTEQDSNPWRVKTAATASVFWLQNPSKLLESVATSLYNFKR